MLLAEHYNITSVQYTFQGCKNGNLQKENVTYFLIFAQNIDRGYTFLTSTQNLCLRAKIRKKMNTSVNPSFTM